MIKTLLVNPGLSHKCIVNGIYGEFMFCFPLRQLLTASGVSYKMKK